MVFELLNQRDQIGYRLKAELRSILGRHLWLGCRHRNQKADAVPVLHFKRNWKFASPVHQTTNDAEGTAK